MRTRACAACARVALVFGPPKEERKGQDLETDGMHVHDGQGALELDHNY